MSNERSNPWKIGMIVTRKVQNRMNVVEFQESKGNNRLHASATARPTTMLYSRFAWSTTRPRFSLGVTASDIALPPGLERNTDLDLGLRLLRPQPRAQGVRPGDPCAFPRFDA